MTTPRVMFGLHWFENRIYAVGGSSNALGVSSVQHVTSVEVLDAEMRSWSKYHADLARGADTFSSAVLANVDAVSVLS